MWPLEKGHRTAVLPVRYPVLITHPRYALGKKINPIDSPGEGNKRSPSSWPSRSLTERRPSSALESLIFQSTSLQCARRWHSSVRTGSSLSCHGIAGPDRRGCFHYYDERSSPLGLLAHWGSRSWFSLLLPPSSPSSTSSSFLLLLSAL